MAKRFFWISCCFLILTISFVKREKLLCFYQENFKEDKIYSFLLEKKFIKKCYEPGNVTVPDFFNYFQQEGFDYIQENDRVVEFSLAKINELNQIKDFTDNQNKIPFITHKIYFTDSDNKNFINDYYLMMLKNTYQKLNVIGEWKHFIWTNNPKVFPSELSNFPNVEVKNLDEFQDRKIYPMLVKMIDDGKNFKGNYAQASDITRILTVNKYGGIYTDMDYEVYNAEELVKYFMLFDYVGAKDDNGFYANGFIAAKPEHPILTEALVLQGRNYQIDKTLTLPETIKYPCSQYQKIYFSGPPLITIAFFHKNNQRNNVDIVLPSWISLNYDLARFKNKSCKYGTISKEFLEKANSNIKQIIDDFKANFKQADSISGYNKNRKFREQENSIFYNLDYRNNYQIIGADMGCGNWSENPSGNNKIFYWNILNYE